MGWPSKRTCAPAPMELPPTATQPAVTSPPPHQPVLPPSFPSAYGPHAWFPPQPSQSMAPALAANLFLGVPQLDVEVPPVQGPWWAPPAVVGASAPPWPTAENVEDSSNPQACSDDNNSGDCARTEKRLKWTKEEDLRLVSAWLSNSNDPIGSNYKKNDQYWKSVTDVYNSTTPKNRKRIMKQAKDHFGRIKKRVAWFCASWKEANALWASGESDVDLMDRAMKSYEVDHKKDGPFMFKHCWEVLREQPKWDAYLERLEELEPDKRKFNVEEEVGQHFSLDDDRDERPIGGKQAKEQKKRKKKDQACIIDLEDEINKLVDAQNQANEGRKEMLETQRRVSSENLEARKLAFLAAKEQKESAMLETYRSMMMQDTTVMSEAMRSEHVLALRCFREKLFGKTD